MVLQFYHHPASQPSRAVYMTIRALGIEHDIHIVDLLSGKQKSPEFLKINPRGKVPAIKDGDFCLGESRAIQAYLINQHGQGLKKELYPTDPVERANVDKMLYISETVELATFEYPALGKLIFGNTPPDESKKPLLEKALQEVDGYLSQSEFIAGPNLTIADFAMCVVVTVPEVLPGGFDYSPYPKLSKWLDYIRALPYHDVCNKQGMGMLASMAESRLNPPIEFYHFLLSPWSRGVYFTLEALGVKYELKEVNLSKQEQKSPEYLKINPRGKVPSVKVGDFCVSESRAVAAYLCNKFADKDHKYLYPEDPKQRGKVDMLLYLGESVFETMNKWMQIGSYFFGDGMPGDDSSEFDKALADIEARIEGKFLTGDHMTIADIFLYVAIVIAQTGALYDFSPYPKLAALVKNIQSLPYHEKVHGQAFAAVKGMVKDKLPKLKGKKA